MSRHELSWDPAKDESNQRQLGISFEEAAEALDDPRAIVRADHDHSEYENRFVLIGHAASELTLTVIVIYTIRGESARIISARRSTRAERRLYMSDEKTIHDAPMDDAEMLEEYGHLEGWQPRMHRFRRAAGTVLLDPDVAAVFRSSEAVNRGLRILIAEGRVPKDPSDE